jgi:hypothetical protein
VRLHRKALRGGSSKHREGSASRAERRAVLPHRGPGVPIDAQLPAAPWPPQPAVAAPAAIAPVSESTLDWMRQNAPIDLDRADYFETLAAELLDQAARLRHWHADFTGHLRAHDAEAGQLPSTDDYCDYARPAAPDVRPADGSGDTTMYVFQARTGWLFRCSADGTPGLGTWRFFRNPPAGAWFVRTVTATDGNRYVLGEFFEHGRLRSITWLAAAGPEDAQDGDSTDLAKLDGAL